MTLPTASNSSPVTAPPGESTRTVVSLLLFLHFFAVGVGVTSNWVPSMLEAALRRVPFVTPYLGWLNFDRSYISQFTLTDGDPIDTVHTIECDLRQPDGSTKQVVLGETARYPQSARSYHRLATAAAGMVGNQELESRLPQAAAAYLVDTYPDMKVTSIRCRRQLLLNSVEVGSSDPRVRDPNDSRLFQTLYEARVLSAGGQLLLRKVESASDVAPPAETGTP